MFRTALLVLALVALGACKPQVDCSNLAAASVNLTLVDAAGNAIPEALVTYDAGEGPVNCDAITQTSYACGFEIEGEIAIHIEAPGYDSYDETVTFAADECHVIPEALSVELGFTTCDAVFPAVRATVSGSTGETLEDVAVSWNYADVDSAPEPCDALSGAFEPETTSVWECGYGASGDITVFVDATGHSSEHQTVTVPSSGACSVETVEISFALDYESDASEDTGE